MDGHTIDVGEIVFSAQVDFDRFAFLEEVVLKTGFAAFVDRTFSFGNQSLEAKRLRDPEKFIFGTAKLTREPDIFVSFSNSLARRLRLAISGCSRTSFLPRKSRSKP